MARALATIEEVLEVKPHDNADALEIAVVRGWNVITRIGEVSPGDKVIYFEIDTMLHADDERFSFFIKRGVKTDPVDGYKGHVLRTAKLRGKISQGLLLSVELFADEIGDDLTVGRDVTSVLNLRKWDPPVPAALAGKAKGNRPSFVPMTDAERIQNVTLAEFSDTSNWVATEKVDGTSTSYYYRTDADESANETSFGACSRNLELENVGQSQWKVAEELAIEALLSSLAAELGATKIVLQGELVGPGIQSNPLQLRELRYFAFRLIVDGRDLPTPQWPGSIRKLAAPVLAIDFPSTIDEAIEAADALDSQVTPGRTPEGIVWRYEGDAIVPERIVKAISNRYLLKQKD